MACVLCIDDNQDVLKSLGEVLRTSGYGTLTALSGNQRLRLLLKIILFTGISDDIPKVRGKTSTELFPKPILADCSPLSAS